MSKSKSYIAAVLAAGAALAAGVSPAHAAPVQWSVTIGAPVIAYPAQVYSRPEAVYAPAAPVLGWQGHRRVAHQQPPRWDRDGDGIPNRHDRLYNPRWDQDGDGIPNRHDRHDDRYDDRRWRGR